MVTDITKPKLTIDRMTTAINLLEKKTSTSENIKLQFLEIKKEKLKLKKEKVEVYKGMLENVKNINTTLSFFRDEIAEQYLNS